MIVAVTGGTGFIGARLVARHLAAGDAVRVLSRRPAGSLPGRDVTAYYRGDLADEAADLRPFVDGADVLYHCAGETRDPRRMRPVNVGGTARLAAAAAGRIGRWVQLSSIAAYGVPAAGTVTEETPPAPAGAYQCSRAESDALAARWAADGAFGLAILRPSQVIGPGLPDGSLTRAIALIDRGLFFFVGSPGAVVNYIHVDCVVDALLRCGRMPGAEARTYNVSEHRTLEELAAAIAEALGKKAPSLRLPEAPVRLAVRILGKIPGFPLTEARLNGMVRRTVYAAARIRSELGYRHPVSIEEGLRQLVEERKRSA